ncbi:hypothetical protein F183_A29310 [Bryobacterales bacterium F-183]|nr:hypothetical protein F183_A29310 [Bryobacterales bacterium F-183]
MKILLGYAPGVGKSFRMLDEGRRRKARGQDVVVACTQATQEEAAGLLATFEVIPPLPGGAIDLDAVHRRRPGMCLIDGLAWTNPPGSKHPQRWQDIEELLAAGIGVIATINLQYVAERQERVEAIRGRHVRESVPESFLRTADDIEVVDAPALDATLAELREIALVLAAEVVDSQLSEYLKRDGIAQSYGVHERILVCITPRSNAALMIERAHLQAERFHGDLFVACVEQDNLSDADRQMLDQNLETARRANAHIALLRGSDFVQTILRFAEKENITQIFVGHSQRTGFWQRFGANPVERLILESGGMDIRIFPQQTRAQTDG